jgi:branched-chain amino acid transport system ATP-binding protein
VWFTIRGFPFHVPRTPRRFFSEMSGGEALFPLIVLAGLACVERLDQAAFGVLAPDIRDAFNMSNQGFLTLVALTQLGGLLLAIPLAYYSDRLPRIAITLIGAAIWGVFGFATGLCFSIWALVVVRSGAGIGRAVITPTHNSLMSDYYPPEVRPDVFGFHSIGTATGALIGPVAGGILAHFFGWRVPFLVFAFPTFVFVILALRLHEPGRGHWERAASGASEAVVGTDEVPPSYAESIRILWQVGTLRRIWYALPFLAASFLGLVTLTSLYYEQVFNLGDAQRGIVAAASEPAQILAILLGIPLAARLMLRDPGLGLRMLAIVGTAIAGFRPTSGSRSR